MAHEITSKNIDGITDLVVIAPIKEGFIDAYENVTYSTRLRIVAEALNRVRVSVREHETMMPFEDVTERIQGLLDFRIGIDDKDLFALAGKDPKTGKPGSGLESRRFLYLTATFDGAWEPYMRQIWHPMGPFLDLLFCNCEGYITAAEHSFEQYAQWVRDNQMDSAIFYATTGLTIRDHLYLNRLEQIQRGRSAAVADRAISRLTMPRPDRAAAAERNKALSDLAKRDPAQLLRIHELALEALTVLYRLADFYPPEWLAGQQGLSEGVYLMRATREILFGWDDLIKKTPPPIWAIIQDRYRDPLSWYTSGMGELVNIDAATKAKRPKDPRFDRSEVQGGLLTSQGDKVQMRQGVLLLFTITDAKAARTYLGQLDTQNEINFEAGAGHAPVGGLFRTIAFTADGLERIGVKKKDLDWFPKEFREGMEMRSGLFGDMRENHPREWTLPRRNWPPLAPGADAFAKARPPIETSEIDIVLQVRTADTDRAVIEKEVARIAAAAASGMSLLGYQIMHAEYDSNGMLIDYFRFSDGVSQPRPVPELDDRNRKCDEVPLGEILLGYRNDRMDFAPIDFPQAKPRDWRLRARKRSLSYQLNGSFLVIRKIEQCVDRFERFLNTESDRINLRHPKLKTPMTPDRLKARMLGREANGAPPIPPGPEGRNDFNYKADPTGVACPFASHIRRANPREPFLGRNAPRLMRRGMSFDDAELGKRGLMFMAYNASIAEQYETVQRWINGGNSTYVASGHMDPITGVAPKSGKQVKVDRMFRFVEGKEVIRVTMPKPFVSLHWGLYLFVPSRSALRKLHRLTETIQPIGEMFEHRGQDQLERLQRMRNDGEAGKEWKRLLEDFDTKDPSERDITAHVWSAIRYYKGGSFKIGGGVPWYTALIQAFHSRFLGMVDPGWDKPAPDKQPVVLCASYRHVMRVLSDWEKFTTEEQLRRIEPSKIPIFVTQQPDDKYRNKTLRGRFHYRKESEQTNAILMGYGEQEGFADGYEAGVKVLKLMKDGATQVPPYFKLELRRQYILPALGELCRTWYGIPDGVSFKAGAWEWTQAQSRTPACPADFLSPSRATFYPRPGPQVSAFADQHGKAIHDGMEAFVNLHWNNPAGVTGKVAKAMFLAIRDKQVLIRNLVGTLIGAIPPMDGNLRGILLEWLIEQQLWRHQAALRRAMGDRPASSDIAGALSVLRGPISRAICKRPAPDLLYRTALQSTHLNSSNSRGKRVKVDERDLVVVSLVSATQRSLQHEDTPDGEVSIVFGGNRKSAYQADPRDRSHPVHACPAQHMAMGAMMGIMAALLDAGRIQALPASLIVKISDW